MRGDAVSGYLWRGHPDLKRVNAELMADRSLRAAEVQVLLDSHVPEFTWRTRLRGGRPGQVKRRGVAT
jgi:hypothetical protein